MRWTTWGRAGGRRRWSLRSLDTGLILGAILGCIAGSVAATFALTEQADGDTAAEQPAAPPRSPGDDPPGGLPRSVLVVALCWAVLLVASLVCYERIDAFADFVSFKLGRLPFETIWFGAAGGLLISAQGIFEHNRDWDRSYDYWHYMRPVLGALIGTLGCLVFLVLNDAATNKHVASNAVFYDVIALAIGYREATFRQLIAKLVDTIIGPGETNKEKETGTVHANETATRSTGR